MTATSPIHQIKYLSFDLYDSGFPSITIDFIGISGEQLFLDIRQTECLQLLQKAGRYSYESFSDQGGTYFVYELQFHNDQDYLVRVKVEDRIKSLKRRDFEAIINEALKSEEYRQFINPAN